MMILYLGIGRGIYGREFRIMHKNTAGFNNIACKSFIYDHSYFAVLRR